MVAVSTSKEPGASPAVKVKDHTDCVAQNSKSHTFERMYFVQTVESIGATGASDLQFDLPKQDRAPGR